MYQHRVLDLHSLLHAHDRYNVDTDPLRSNADRCYIASHLLHILRQVKERGNTGQIRVKKRLKYKTRE